MKKISLFPSLLLSTICALGLMTSVVSAQLPGSLTNGLVGYWSFDGNGNDSSSALNNANISGAEFVSDRFGQPNSALSVTNYPGGAVTQNNFTITGNSARTMSFWTKFFDQGTEYSYTSSAVYWGDYSGVGTKSLFMESSSGGFWFNGNYADLDNKTPNDLPAYNIWRLVTLTYENSLTSAAQYINGILQTNVTFGTVLSETLNTAQTPLTMSGDFIDDVTIYNRALSPTEVTDLYNAQVVPEPSTYALLLLSGAASLWALKRRKS